MVKMYLAAVGFLALPLGPLAIEQATTVPSKPVADLQQCRNLSDGATRLGCYDKAVDTLIAATASNEIVIIERQEVRKTRKGLFGFTLPRIGFLNGRGDNAEDRADAAELETTITASRSVGYGKWRFTVEGGAVWETIEASSGFSDPLVGQKAFLQKGALGAYYVKVNKGRRVQARRVG